MQTIKLPTKRPSSPHPVLNLGFRIFFLGASVMAMLTMLKWSHLTFATHFRYADGQMLPFFWHGHEMVYGYALAVIAGFLLTAVKTWTGQLMPYGWRLLAIFVPWALARLIFLFNGIHLNGWTWVGAGLDISFWLLVMFFVVRPIWQVRQKRQIGIVAKLLLLMVGQLWFYVVLWRDPMSIAPHYALLFGFYLVIGVVLTIGRRVMPMFIERGVAGKQPIVATVNNSTLLDRCSLVSFFVFFLTDVFFSTFGMANIILSASAIVVAVTNALRLKNWHLTGIWSRPLLWSLWLSFAGMVVGFGLFVIQPWLGFNRSVAFHAVALSGVGLMTLAMMSRVSLGHTGRDIHTPPALLPAIFGAMILAWLARVGLGMWSGHYLLSLGISQGLWLVAFGLFVVCFGKILLSPRPDGLFG